MDHEKTGRYIAACRKKKKMTQKDLAGRLGVTNKAVSKWETGQGMPDISVLLELARVLDVPVEAILEGGPAETETVQPALQEYTTPSGVMEHPEKKERVPVCAGRSRGYPACAGDPVFWLCRSGTSLTETGIRSSIWPGGCSLP